MLFSSDLHGNDEHLERLLRHAEHVEAVDVVVLGGDLGPRGTGFGRDADGMRDLLSHLPKRGDGKIDWTTDEALAYDVRVVPMYVRSLLATCWCFLVLLLTPDS